MKRFLAIVTVIVMMLSLCACGSSVEEQKAPEVIATARPEPLTTEDERALLKHGLSQATGFYDCSIVVSDTGEGLYISITIDTVSKWVFADIIFCATNEINKFIDAYGAPLKSLNVTANMGVKDPKEITALWTTDDLENGIFLDDSTDTVAKTDMHSVLQHCGYDEEEMSNITD